MMQLTHTWRKVLESSLSPSVRITPTYLHNAAANGSAELELDEEGTRISLTIVDTPGFGDQIDNEARSGESPYPTEQLLTCL